ncbi:MAG: hypothetical protein ACK5KK_07390, partial [Microbacterium sp.]
MTTPEPRHELSHLGPHGLFTPTPVETVAYFRDLLGMDVVAVRDGVTYLRSFNTYEAWTVKVIASDRAGMEYVSWRM